MGEPGRDGVSRRVEVVNALLGLAGPGLPPLAADGDLDGERRGVYERGLGLGKGALAWGRFEGEGAEFSGWPAARIVSRLEDERVVVAADGGAGPGVMSAEDYLAETFADLGLEPRQTLWLTGSPDVRRALEAMGAAAPLLRSAPSQEQLRGYALAVMCRGPVGHKVMNPWTEAIARMAPFAGPRLVHAASSNISGIARSVWEQREGLRAYVERWRAGG
jgi:hypothetical protein